MLPAAHTISIGKLCKGVSMTAIDVSWRFRKMTRADMNQDPMEREFFDEEPINTRLVREAIQNSLDAGVAHAFQNHSSHAGEPVRVRFSLAGIHAPLPPHLAKRYFVGLAPHLNALTEIDDTVSVLAARENLTHDGVPFIVVEDSGTIGLEGNWEQHNDSEREPAESNHFYWFFRNVGRSGKGDSDNGSWGLGKSVFPATSHASSYIAVTRQRSDDETLLMGLAVLNKHDIDGQPYVPYGYFATFEDDGFQLPLRRSEPTHRAFIDQCIADFGLQYRNSPGLSVIIPFPRIEDEESRIETPMMLAAIIHNYFYPIIIRRLEVTLDEGDGSPPIDITADTIDDVLNYADLKESGEQSVSGYRNLFEMCRKCMELTDDDYIDVPIGELGDENHQGIAGLRRKYNAYELLAFRVATDVQRKRGSQEPSEFLLYVQRDDSLTSGHDYYVRGTLSISEMNYLGQIRARSLLVVNENDSLAAMLRDSEPPAHTLWRNQNVHRLSEHWVASNRRINAVRHAPRTLLRTMDTPTEGIQKDAFADIFFYERPGEEAGRRPTKGRRINPDPITPPPPTSKDFDIQDTHSGTGFRVRIASESENPPTGVRLRVAYEVPRGNPLKQYSPNDFRLHGAGALSVEMRGCQVISQHGNERAGNELFLQVDDPKEFTVTTQGFDPNRDVLVRVERFEDATLFEGDTA